MKDICRNLSLLAAFVIVTSSTEAMPARMWAGGPGDCCETYLLLMEDTFFGHCAYILYCIESDGTMTQETAGTANGNCGALSIIPSGATQTGWQYNSAQDVEVDVGIGSGGTFSQSSGSSTCNSGTKWIFTADTSSSVWLLPKDMVDDWFMIQ